MVLYTSIPCISVLVNMYSDHSGYPKVRLWATTLRSLRAHHRKNRWRVGLTVTQVNWHHPKGMEFRWKKKFPAWLSFLLTSLDIQKGILFLHVFFFRGPNTKPQVVVVYLRFPKSPEITFLFLLAHDVSIGRQAGTLRRLLLGVEGKSSKGSLGRLRGSTGTETMQRAEVSRINSEFFGILKKVRLYCNYTKCYP